ncbi:MAG: hypothetical protein ACYTGJ_04960 [Planctomycetota bacterium]|jgi:hypothetical protein
MSLDRRHPLRLAPLLLLLAASLPCAAQGDASGLRAKYDAKLAEPFAKAVDWALSLEDAKRRAREENKPILGYFTRSYSP